MEAVLPVARAVAKVSKNANYLSDIFAFAVAGASMYISYAYSGNIRYATFTLVIMPLYYYFRDIIIEKLRDVINNAFEVWSTLKAKGVAILNSAIELKNVLSTISILDKKITDLENNIVGLQEEFLALSDGVKKIHDDLSATIQRRILRMNKDFVRDTKIIKRRLRDVNNNVENHLISFKKLMQNFDLEDVTRNAKMRMIADNIEHQLTELRELKIEMNLNDQFFKKQIELVKESAGEQLNELTEFKDEYERKLLRVNEQIGGNLEMVVSGVNNKVEGIGNTLKNVTSDISAIRKDFIDELPAVGRDIRVPQLTRMVNNLEENYLRESIALRIEIEKKLSRVSSQVGVIRGRFEKGISGVSNQIESVKEGVDEKLSEVNSRVGKLGSSVQTNISKVSREIDNVKKYTENQFGEFAEFRDDFREQVMELDDRVFRALGRVEGIEIHEEFKLFHEEFSDKLKVILGTLEIAATGIVEFTGVRCEIPSLGVDDISKNVLKITAKSVTNILGPSAAAAHFLHDSFKLAKKVINLKVLDKVLEILQNTHVKNYLAERITLKIQNSECSENVIYDVLTQKKLKVEFDTALKLVKNIREGQKADEVSNRAIIFKRSDRFDDLVQRLDYADLKLLKGNVNKDRASQLERVLSDIKLGHLNSLPQQVKFAVTKMISSLSAQGNFHIETKLFIIKSRIIKSKGGESRMHANNLFGNFIDKAKDNLIRPDDSNDIDRVIELIIGGAVISRGREQFHSINPPRRRSASSDSGMMRTHSDRFFADRDRNSNSSDNILEDKGGSFDSPKTRERSDSIDSTDSLGNDVQGRRKRPSSCDNISESQYTNALNQVLAGISAYNCDDIDSDSESVDDKATPEKVKPKRSTTERIRSWARRPKESPEKNESSISP